ncbi:MAG: methyltransferase domain-containing protein [Nitrospirae bacterium]|nr:methyltransferase domain-containing protein [Nitrospirota bacterium]
MADNDLIELRNLYQGFMASRVILTANNLSVFDGLKKASGAPGISKKLKADERAVEILLDALSGMGLVIKGKDGKYRNAPVSNRYLVKGSPFFQGDIIRHSSGMWEAFSHLDEILRSGRPAARRRNHEAFIMGMHNLTKLRTGNLIRAVGLKGVSSMLDLGGGPGTNAMAIAKRGVKATIFDLPETVSIAKRVARHEGVNGLRYIAGDFHIDSIGFGYDLILLSQIFHAFSADENKALLRKCAIALNPGGRVAVQEFPLNEERTAPRHSAVFSVNMLVQTENGRCYSPAEIKGWLVETGFKDVAVKNLPETVCVIGRLSAQGREK